MALLPRRTSVDCEFGGVSLRAGETVLFAISSANRDPRVFDDPDVFDPSRPRLKESLVFGHGSHFCLGAQLAREEMKVGLGALLERFPDLSRVDAASVQVVGATLRGPRELRVRTRSS